MKLATTLVLLSSLLTSALASPAPAPMPIGVVDTSLSARSAPESVTNATSLGVDVFGPIPSDAVLVSPGYYTAEPGTAAWAWIRAQIDLSPVAAREELEKRGDYAELEKRQTWASIGIGMFAQDWCQGQAGWFDNVQYNVQHMVNINMFSVGISYRGLRANEHLDFSRRSGNDWCGLYLYSAGQNTPTGCFNSQLINCFRLWLS